MEPVRIRRPAEEEVPSFYRGYVSKVLDEKVPQRLGEQLDEIARLYERLDDTSAAARYAPGKWSLKEVLGHLIDAERVFSYRLFRIGRGDATPLAGFDENAYVAAGNFDARPIRALLEEFRAARGSTLALLEGIGPESWERRGVTNQVSVSAGALAYIILGHANHHLEVLRTHYGL
jgi:hypothetical protein